MMPDIVRAAACLKFEPRWIPRCSTCGLFDCWWTVVLVPYNWRCWHPSSPGVEKKLTSAGADNISLAGRDCQVSAWTEWSMCDETYIQKYRRREALNTWGLRHFRHWGRRFLHRDPSQEGSVL